MTAAVLARSAHPGLAQTRMFVIFAVIMLGVLPLILLVPDHRGRW